MNKAQEIENGENISEPLQTALAESLLRHHLAHSLPYERVMVQLPAFPSTCLPNACKRYILIHKYEERKTSNLLEKQGAPSHMAEDAQKDFFVSYNKADRAWAEWIAWQ